MSPPKVSLSGKDTLKPVDEPESPAVITVDGERSIRITRHVQQRQRARRVICGVAFVIILAIAALGTMVLVHKMRRHHRRHFRCGGPRGLHEDVHVDPKNQLIRVQHDHDQLTQTPAMEILHEYNRRMVAYKDQDKKICYIDRLDETFEDGYERWEAYERHDRKDEKTLRVIGRPIEVEVMKHICDIHITAHCQDAKSVWVMEIEETEVTTEMEVIRV